MKSKLLFLNLLGVLSLIIVLNSAIILAETNYCNPTIKIINQDPNPAVPNEYVKVLFEVTNLNECDGGFSIKLNPEYPFSLEDNVNAIQTVETNPYAVGYRSVWMIPYTLRVDSDAFEGDYNLKLQYQEGSNANFNSYSEQEFNIPIEDARTDFDLVIQESTGIDISIAIANIGKNTANSLIVRIPKQDNYAASGTNGQMVGNLDSGDYTIVSFSLTPLGRGGDSNDLKVQLDYTDNIGERRSIIKNVSFISSSPVGFNISEQGSIGNFPRGNFPNQKTNNNIFKSVWFWVVVIVLVGIGYYHYKKNPNKIKNFFLKLNPNKNKSRSEKISKSIPEWVSAERTKRS